MKDILRLKQQRTKQKRNLKTCTTVKTLHLCRTVPTTRDFLSHIRFVIFAHIMSLEQRYWGSFIICGLLCLALQVFGYFQGKSKTVGSSSNTRFQSFQRNYLLVFMLAMFSDWLQGPYVYELYVSYGFSQSQIAELFVCGFGSSMIVGLYVSF